VRVDTRKKMAEGREKLFPRFIIGKDIGDVKADEIVHALLPRCGVRLTAVIPKPRQVFELVLSDENLAFELERDGFPCKGKHVHVYPSVPKGTWIRIRGIPLFWTKDIVVGVFSEYGQITSGPTEILYRDTHVSTGDRSLKIDLVRSIPQDVAAHFQDETFALSVRYREQPKACFTCGELGHIKLDCPRSVENTRSYSSIVSNKNRHTHTTERRQQNTTQQHNPIYTQPQSTPVTTIHASTPVTTSSIDTPVATTSINTPVTTASINTPVTTPHTNIPVTTAPTKPSCTPPKAKQNNTYTAPSTQQAQKYRRSLKQNNNKRKGAPSVERADRQKHRNISGSRTHLLSDGECTD